MAEVRTAPAYGPLSAAFHAAHTPCADSREVAWYASRLPSDAGTLLEAMVGTGRLLAPMLDAGFAIHGVDASQAMLDACAARVAVDDARTSAAQGGRRRTSLFRQHSAVLNLPFRYGAIYVAAGSFQLLADAAEAASALARFRAHLLPPGLLVLDLVVPGAAEHPPGAAVIEVRQATLGDGSHITRRSETRCDIERRRIAVASRYEHKRGPSLVAREDETVLRTWYGESEIAAALDGAGYVSSRIEASPLAHAGGHRFAVVARAW
jgi:hypothetical protein